MDSPPLPSNKADFFCNSMFANLLFIGGYVATIFVFLCVVIEAGTWGKSATTFQSQLEHFSRHRIVWRTAESSRRWHI